MTRIGLVGDTHGNLKWMLYCIDKMEREGIQTVVQVGDFGIWPGSRAEHQMDVFSAHLKKANQVWYVVPGNHDDYDQIDALMPSRFSSGDPLGYFRENIILIPRGFRWSWDNTSFVALGGAPSVDRAVRVKHKWGWWPQEAITREDIDMTVAGGYADVMITHDAPFGSGQIAKHIKGNPFGFAAEDLDYAAEGRINLTEAVLGVKPKILIHGHYHYKVIEDVHYAADNFTVKQFGLNRDDANHSLGFIDTETQHVEIWDLMLDYNEYKWSQ